MDLFAPCRSCLQCLPFFQVSPASPPRLPAAATSSSLDAPKTAPTDSSQSSQGLPSPSPAPTLPEQDLCLPIKPEKEPQAGSCGKDNTGANSPSESTETESEALPVSGIVIAPPVSSPGSGPLPEDEEDDKFPTVPEVPLDVPFINDITLSGTGFLPLQSPITPAPIGSGYPAGQYPLLDQIYQHGHSQSHHGHETEQHDHHEHSLQGHESSHHSQYWHGHLHHGHTDDSHDGDDGLHKHASHHHSPHHSHIASISDDADTSVTGYPSFLHVDHHDNADNISPTPLLEASQSTPELDLDAKVSCEHGAVTDMNGTSAPLKMYHSGPVVLPGDSPDDDNEGQHKVLGLSASHQTARRRRRDHFRDQFKGIKQQVKQGGHHLREEGSKHMQNIIENMNKQAQQLEQSGAFFMVPRANNN